MQCWQIMSDQRGQQGAVRNFPKTSQHHASVQLSRTLTHDASGLVLGRNYVNIKVPWWGGCQCGEVGIPRQVILSCRPPWVTHIFDAEPPRLKELKSNEWKGRPGEVGLGWKQPGNEAGSIWLAAASNTHCEKLTVCSEIRVRNFSTWEGPV